jgi:hypothetical protein
MSLCACKGRCLNLCVPASVIAAVCAQAFNWESHKKPWYRECMGKVSEWAKQGITSIWLPPPSDSVSPQVRGVIAIGRGRRKGGREGRSGGLCVWHLGQSAACRARGSFLLPTLSGAHPCRLVCGCWAVGWLEGKGFPGFAGMPAQCTLTMSCIRSSD